MKRLLELFKLSAIFGLCFLMLQACVLYKPYKRPPLEIPETWRVPMDETSTVINEEVVGALG